MQGNPISPLIFNIAIEPLLHQLGSGVKGLAGEWWPGAIGFADDLTLLAGLIALHERSEGQSVAAGGPYDDLLKELRARLETLKSFCKATTTQLNAKKCRLLVISKGRIISDPALCSVMVGDPSKPERIPLVGEPGVGFWVKYLGFIMTFARRPRAVLPELNPLNDATAKLLRAKLAQWRAGDDAQEWYIDWRPGAEKATAEFVRRLSCIERSMLRPLAKMDTARVWAVPVLEYLSDMAIRDEEIEKKCNSALETFYRKCMSHNHTYTSEVKREHARAREAARVETKMRAADEVRRGAVAAGTMTKETADAKACAQRRRLEHNAAQRVEGPCKNRLVTVSALCFLRDPIFGLMDLEANACKRRTGAALHVLDVAAEAVNSAGLALRTAVLSLLLSDGRDWLSPFLTEDMGSKDVADRLKQIASNPCFPFAGPEVECHATMLSRGVGDVQKLSAILVPGRSTVQELADALNVLQEEWSLSFTPTPEQAREITQERLAGMQAALEATLRDNVCYVTAGTPTPGAQFTVVPRRSCALQRTNAWPTRKNESLWHELTLTLERLRAKLSLSITTVPGPHPRRDNAGEDADEDDDGGGDDDGDVDHAAAPVKRKMSWSLVSTRFCGSGIPGAKDCDPCAANDGTHAAAAHTDGVDPERAESARKIARAERFSELLHACPANSVVIATDGSCTAGLAAGAAAIIATFDVVPGAPPSSIRSMWKFMPHPCTSAYAELQALKMGLSTALADVVNLNNGKRPLVIMCDSVYVLQVAAGGTLWEMHPEVCAEVYALASTWSAKVPVTLLHCPSHLDQCATSDGSRSAILLNFIADALSGEAATRQQEAERVRTERKAAEASRKAAKAKARTATASATKKPPTPEWKDEPGTGDFPELPEAKFGGSTETLLRAAREVLAGRSGALARRLGVQPPQVDFPDSMYLPCGNETNFGTAQLPSWTWSLHRLHAVTDMLKALDYNKRMAEQYKCDSLRMIPVSPRVRKMALSCFGNRLLPEIVFYRLWHELLDRSLTAPASFHGVPGLDRKCRYCCFKTTAAGASAKDLITIEAARKAGLPVKDRPDSTQSHILSLCADEVAAHVGHHNLALEIIVDGLKKRLKGAKEGHLRFSMGCTARDDSQRTLPECLRAVLGDDDFTKLAYIDLVYCADVKDPSKEKQVEPYFLVEVTLTDPRPKNMATAYRRKMEKYRPILQKLKEKDIPYEFFIIVIANDGFNLEPSSFSALRALLRHGEKKMKKEATKMLQKDTEKLCKRLLVKLQAKADFFLMGVYHKHRWGKPKDGTKERAVVGAHAGDTHAAVVRRAANIAAAPRS